MNQLHLYLSHLAHNYNVLRAHLKPTTKLIGVVKAGAYGSDAQAIARALEKLGIDQLAVAYTAEGVALKKAGINLPIMVFYPQFETLGTLVEEGLEPVAYSFKILDQLQGLALQKKSDPLPLHLKFNTGLNRLGFSPKNLSKVLKKASASPFSLKSIYSHLAASEDPRPSSICEAQINLFNSLKAQCQTMNSLTVTYHLLNSSGVFNYPEWQFDAVRCGIALYGFANHPAWDKQLKPIARLTSTILQIHTVSAGASVGYNSGWIAPTTAQIATLPLGHADGISRQYGHGKVHVMVNGKKAPIVGNVCMDIVMVDVSGLNCHEGDEVEFFGPQNPASTVAHQGNTIAYELLSNVGPRVKRIIHS